MKLLLSGICGLVMDTTCMARGPRHDDPKTVSENDGVMNGPLLEGGYSKVTKGTKESLRMAIEHLMATYGKQYPRGTLFLKRLEKMKDNKAAGFEALKKEALLANPLLDFDKILAVKSKKGSRHTKNWQTRVSGLAETRDFDSRELTNVLANLCRADKKLAALNAKYIKAKRDQKNVFEKIRRTKEYNAVSGKRNREQYVKTVPDYAKCKLIIDAAYADLLVVAKKFPEYIQAEADVKNKKQSPNFSDQLTILSIKTGKETVLYGAEKFIGEVDLHCNGNKVLFTSHGAVKNDRSLPTSGKGYRIFELEFDPVSGAAKGAPRLAVPDLAPDVDSYDACYLADDKIMFASTASYQGVPCVGGKDFVANLYRVNKDGSDLRRLTFDQEGNWSPTLMENGRVMYQRWEYTDSSHYFSRILLTMNPDGTDQKAFYGSNSYWPNSIFDPRQIPGKSSQFIGTVCGHHDHNKTGALCIFDAGKGRVEADGAVQILTQRGKKVEPIVKDGLTRGHYKVPFMHPYPLSEKYFLANSGQEIYLMDTFDNMVKVGEGYEPIPLRKTKRANLVPDRTDMTKKDATVMINDIYAGPGLKGVARGTVKALRVYRYEYAVRNTGGHYSLAMEGGWDTRQVMGTVPVEDDGSISFKIPANAPFAMQPLDKDGKALLNRL